MMKKLIIAMAVVCALALAFYAVKSYRENARTNVPGFAHGNGRLEATEVAVATKLAGKVEAVYAKEGALVKKGDKLALMQLNVLNAEMAQAKAALAESNAQVKVRESEVVAAKATLDEKQSSFVRAKSEFERQQNLKKDNASTAQKFEIAESAYKSAVAEVAAAKAGVLQAQAALEAAKANVLSAEAKVARVQADIDDSMLTAPTRGRIQYRVAEPGEVLPSGSSVLNLVDLTDVYMTFFVPETVAGKIAIGADARIVLDAAPEIPIPATITFVSSEAQFTPKTVETQLERQKLMFRVKAQIKPELLEKYIEYVKVGLPGVAWVQLDKNAPWPDFLKTRQEKGIEVKAK